MTRCHYCTGILWPWQSQGWRAGTAERWHGRCLRRFLEIVDQEADQWERIARTGGI